MKKVTILMSAYNGSNVIEQQIRSIMEQQNVEIYLVIRDDGSSDNTCAIVSTIQNEYNDKITLIKGKNIGWKKSFLELLKYADKSDYYGFSDQDDYWFPEKVINSISEMEKDSYHGVKMVHVNSLCVDEKLNIQAEQQKRYPYPRNRKSVIAQEYYQGCSMLWNSIAMKELKKYFPKADLAHDFWVGSVCYYLGKTYYIDTPQFYHIRYKSNSSSDGNVNAGRRKRLSFIKNRKTVYMNPSKDIINGYKELLKKEDLKFLNLVVKSSYSLKDRLILFFMMDFRRESIKSTLLFKLMLLLGKY